MLANPKTLLVIVSCALVAHAQSASGTSTTATAPASQSSLPAGLDPCIVGCASAAAASNGCSSYTDLACVCTSTAFQAAAGACIQTNCTSSDAQAAQQVQQQECAAFSSGASTTASTAASTGTSSGTSASASHSATSSSAAMALSAPLSLGSLVGTLVASAGALVGAAFVL